MITRLVTMVALAATVVFAPSVYADEAEGKAVFQKKCTICHDVEKKKMGPALTTMSHDTTVLREAVTMGRNMMPGFQGKLSDEEIDSVIEYLKSVQ